ncbi:tyrosine-type recombinase/integrase [Nocardia pseudovaccinii]|uniref:tyrosine-type recombinase/integrase n=1 Tax=Nocardia pseudovaccinii TaxID=189540 RepID=UPI003D8CBD19
MTPTTNTGPPAATAGIGASTIASLKPRTGVLAEQIVQRFPARPVSPPWKAVTGTIEEAIARIGLAQFRSQYEPTNAGRRQGARKLLRWLQNFPGETWQQRWDASHAADHGEDWTRAPLDWLSACGEKQRRGDLQTGLLILVVADVIRLDLSFMSTLKRTRFWTEAVATHRDPAGFAQLESVTAPSIWSSSAGNQARWQIAVLILAKGGRIHDITVGDCVELRQLELTMKVNGSRRYLFYALLSSASVFPPGAPASLRMITKYSGQHSVEELIDRYQLTSRPVRNLLVDYLAERQPALDFTSLEHVSRTLGLYFWKNLETHHPGIASLHLDREVAAAWKERLRTKTTRKRLPDGSSVEITSPRASYTSIITQVRAFYLDLAQWAAEDPSRWAQWAAPSPVSVSDIGFRKLKSRRKARMDQRTRDQLPLLPALVQAAEQKAREARIRLDAALAANEGEQFTVLGETFTKAVLWTRQSERRQTTIVIDSTGRRRRLREAENRAFWSWAAVEFLRHTGVRIEEMLEISHHSITQYRLPNTGEVIPLLHIAPSKTDEERLLVISPELADVLSTIVTRVRTSDGRIPLVPFYDRHERVWETPTPLLFQWNLAGHDMAISTTTIRRAIREILDSAGPADADGQPLYFRPHDLRRIFTTEAILNGMPPHIAQMLLGHKDITTTMGYKAVYPEEAINGHRAFIARRRTLRPSEEYRTPTDAEWDEFLGHFERRKVALGECGRAYGTNCQHEHSCLRCPVLRVDPAQRGRLEQIRDNLTLRITEPKTKAGSVKPKDFGSAWPQPRTS